jgi:acyl-CoA synthetase (NDP forming)
LDHGVANNPLDMGGIIGGPGRFTEVVDLVAGSGDYDMVLAVSTAHPPAHTEERVSALLGLDSPVPVLHLWMAGDQAGHGLDLLRSAARPVIEEPRAAMRAVAGLAGLTCISPTQEVAPLDVAFEDWGLPLVEGEVAADAGEAVEAAGRLGYPVVVKVSSPGLAHKTEIGGVRLGLESEESVTDAFEEVLAAARAAGLEVDGARVERYRPGLELIVAALVDPVFGPLVSVGMGGVLTELLGDVVFAPAPVDESGALGMINRLRGRPLLDGFRGGPPADVGGLARVVSVVSRGLVGSAVREIEVNPVIWTGEEWVAVDWLVVAGTA